MTARGLDSGMYVLGLTATGRGGDVAVRVGVVDEVVVGARVDTNVIVRELAHLRIVDTEDLGIFGRTQTEAGDEVHDPQDDSL